MKKPRNWNESVGWRFGRLAVIRPLPPVPDEIRKVACRCDCGEVVILPINTLGTKTNSCGCLRRDLITTHGMHNTPEYRAWNDMIQRCKSPKNRFYQNYGGRGIKVCDQWLKFDAFIKDVGIRPSNKHSLDRINNDGNYEPGNVRWAEREIQDNNKTTSTRITFNGETLSVAQWGRKLGLHREVLRYRLKHWPVEKALTKPSQRARSP